MRNTLIALAAIWLLAAPTPAAAERAATTKPAPVDVAWQKHHDNAEFVRSTRRGTTAPDVLKVTGPGTIRVLEIENPQLAFDTYAITGRVKYENVTGTGYLEMWSTFPDGSAYFARTVESGGPQRSISGSSDWRPFTLPFYARKGSRPSKLEVNLVLPEGGTVYLEAGQLVQDSDAMANAWWGGRRAGWGGAIGGTALGLLGGLIGLLAGRGKARQLVFALLIAMLAIGGTCLLLGIVAIAMRQPYAVYYPLLLCGGLATLLPLTIIPQMKRRYEELELRRMSALDAT
jgi:hypothetical protein